MLLDKTLVLKGLAGVAAVGGVVGGGFAMKKTGLFSPSSNADAAQPGPTNSNTGEDLTNSHSNAGDIQENVDNTPQQEQKLTVTEDHGDEKGLPAGCEDKKKCELTEDTIKRVKFKVLEEGGTGDVTVTPSSINVALTIKGDNKTKRYIFENKGSAQVTLVKGSVSFSLPQGKSRFVVEGNKFNPMKMGSYGLPSRCSSSCDLLGDDLGLIHFSGFTGTEEATVAGLDEEQKVSLTIENGTYVFNSPSSVTITKGGTSVKLESGETDFGVEQEKLKKVELWTFGLPKGCEYKEESETTTCTLSSKDLKKVKFKDIGSSPNVSGLTGNEKVTLEIKKTEDSSYPDKRKYIFTSDGTGDVTITNTGTSQSITISKEDETAFRKESAGSEVLVALPKRVKPTDEVKNLDNKINDLGLPSTCTFTEKASGDNKSIECELSKEELKNLKFSDGQNGQDQDLTISTIDGDDINYKIRIEEATGENHFSSKNIRVTFLNRDSNSWSKMLSLNVTGDGSEPLIIYKNSDTEFKITDKNRLQKAWKLSDLSGLVGLNCGEESDTSSNCSLKNEAGNGNIKVYLEEGIKDFKPGDLGSNLCFVEDEDGFSQGIKFKVSSAIEGTIDGTSKSLGTGEYEIRRFESKGWALAKQSLNHNYPHA